MEDVGDKEAQGDEIEKTPSLDAQGPATSSQIQKVLDCLQPHLDDPDVQGNSMRLKGNIILCA